MPRISAVHTGLATVAIFFGGFGTWAALAPLDGAVVGQGALAVHGNSKTVQHKEGGIVAALFVQEGDRVARGQVLVRLDDTQLRAMLGVHEAQLLGDEALCARDLAEVAGAPAIAFPPDLRNDDPVARSVVAREQVVFDTHRDLMAQQLRITDERIAQAREQQAGAVAQHEAAMRGLAYGTQQLAALGLGRRRHLVVGERRITGVGFGADPVDQGVGVRQRPAHGGHERGVVDLSPAGLVEQLRRDIKGHGFSLSL